MAKKKESADILEQVRSKLGHVSFAWGPTEYVSTGAKELDAVLGHPERGIGYGRIVEVCGMESNGKTALAIDVAAAAQHDGATVIWLDLEISFDPEWAALRGLKADEVIVIRPYVGTFGGGKAKRLTTAQELLEEAEAVMAKLHAGGVKKMVLVVDSVTGMLAEEEAAGGIGDQNMRTAQALPMLLGRLLRRWIGLLQDYRCFALFLNQIRQKPGVRFGSPDYTPGGNALRFYAHVRVRMRRLGKSRVMQGGKVVGIRGVLQNLKNKAGGVEGEECGFKIYFGGRSLFCPAEEIRGDKDGEEAGD